MGDGRDKIGDGIKWVIKEIQRSNRTDPLGKRDKVKSIQIELIKPPNSDHSSAH